jgi:type IV fimbrial biogenesis protein FimT
MKRTEGFTLIEMIVAIAILAILAALAIPSFKSSVRSNRSVSDANALLTSLTLARSEAIKRSQAVVVCKASSSTSPACVTSGSWDQGILTFVDTGNNGSYDSAADTLLRVEVPFSANNTITDKSSLNALSYRADGTTGGTVTTFYIKPTGLSSTQQQKFERCVDVSTLGKPRITDNTTESSLCK